MTRARRRVLAAVRREGGAVTVSALSDGLGLHVTTVRFHLDHLADAGLVRAEHSSAGGRRGRPATLYRAVGPTVEDGAMLGGPTSSRGSAPPSSSEESVWTSMVGALARALADEPDGIERSRRAGRQWAGGLAGASAAQPPRREPARAPAQRTGDAPAQASAPHGGRTDAEPPPAVPARATRPHSEWSPEDAVLWLPRLTDLFARLGFAPQARPWGLRLRSCPFAAGGVKPPPTVCAVHRGLAEGLAGDTAIDLIPFAEPRACHLVCVDSAEPPILQED